MFTHEDLDEKLRATALKGHTNKLLELLEAGANFHVDKEGRNALHFAACYGHSDTVAAILLAGCDVNTPDFSGFTPVQRAAGEGHVDTVKQLIAHGAQVDHQDDVHGNTALHEASWKGYSHTVEVLARAKANAYIKNKGGFAPLHLTCQNGHNQSCRVLLLAGCRPDLRNNYGDTPLHTAARYGHAGVMRILISAKCNVNEQNKNGDTALHIAAAMGRRKLSRILLESNCDQTITNKQGESAKDIATRKEFREVVSILANPPPLRAHADGGETPRPSNGAKPTHKKREKDSGTSKDSKDSGSHRKEKHKKTKHGHASHKPKPVEAAKKRGTNGQDHTSPYGCHNFPDLQAFPSPNLDSLPKEPLRKGEQYYLDLAGNIRKGPVGKGYACYCAPFFQHVEQKLESDKHELMEHIDLAHDDLNEKIAHLERKTRSHLFQISQTVKEKLAEEKEECVQRVERRSVRERLDLARRQDLQAGNIKTELKTWVSARMDDFERRQEQRGPSRNEVLHTLHCSDDEEDEDEDDEEDDCEDDKRVYERHRTTSGIDKFGFAGSPLPVDAPLMKAKSEEMLSARRRAPLPVDAEAEVERGNYLAVRAEPYLNGHAHRVTLSPSPKNDVTIGSGRASELESQDFQDDSGYGTKIFQAPLTSKVVVAPKASGAMVFEGRQQAFSREHLATQVNRWQHSKNWRSDSRRYVMDRDSTVEGRFLTIEERMAKLNEGLRISAASQDGSSLV